MTTLIDQPTRTHIILPLVCRTTYLRRSAHSAVLLFAWFAEHVLDDLHCCACYAHELLFPALQQQSGRGLHPATFRRHECLDSRDTRLQVSVVDIHVFILSLDGTALLRPLRRTAQLLRLIALSDHKTRVNPSHDHD